MTIFREGAFRRPRILTVCLMARLTPMSRPEYGMTMRMHWCLLVPDSHRSQTSAQGELIIKSPAQKNLRTFHHWERAFHHRDLAAISTSNNLIRGAIRKLAGKSILLESLAPPAQRICSDLKELFHASCRHVVCCSEKSNFNKWSYPY